MPSIHSACKASKRFQLSLLDRLDFLTLTILDRFLTHLL